MLTKRHEEDIYGVIGELEAILRERGARRVQYPSSVLYVVDDAHAIDYVNRALDVIDAIGEEAGKTLRTRFANAYVKFVNPQAPAASWSVYRRHKYKLISNPEKVREELDRRLHIYANAERRRLRRALEADPEIGELEADAMRKEVEERIEEAAKKTAYVKERFDDLEVVITDYNRGRYYDELYVTFEDASYASEHLLKEPKINILWHDPQIVIKRPPRSSNKVAEIVSAWEHAEPFEPLASVFYREREDVDGDGKDMS